VLKHRYGPLSVVQACGQHPWNDLFAFGNPVAEFDAPAQCVQFSLIPDVGAKTVNQRLHAALKSDDFTRKYHAAPHLHPPST